MVFAAGVAWPDALVGWPAEGPFVFQLPSVLDMACSCSKTVIKAVDPHKQGVGLKELWHRHGVEELQGLGVDLGLE